MNPPIPNREKWRNKKYPNLQSDVVVPTVPVSFDISIVNTGAYGTISTNIAPQFRIVAPPKTSSSTGQPGDISYDDKYFYVKVNKEWKRIAISEFLQDCNDNVPIYVTEGVIIYDEQFLYIYSNKMWRKVALVENDLDMDGQNGSITYDRNYFYIYTEGSWRRLALSPIT